MKFGTLLELNSNIEWFDKYVDYDGLKKMFPAEPFDQNYPRPSASNDPESSPLMSAEDRPQQTGASQEEFTSALDRERLKVIDFYEKMAKEIETSLETVEKEVRVLEDQELEDTIEEEDEEPERGYQDEPAHHQRTPSTPGPRRISMTDDVPKRPSPATKQSFIAGLASNFQNKFLSGEDLERDEADLLEASLTSQVQEQQQQQQTVGKSRSKSMSRKPVRTLSRSATSDEYDRRMSASSASSGGWGAASGGGFGLSKYRGNLGLIPLNDPQPMLDSIHSSKNDAAAASSPAQTSHSGPRLGGHESSAPLDYIWTATSDYGKVLRLSFKKRIARIWLDAHALQGYVDLNLTAFEKILKKYDKNTGSKLKKSYIEKKVSSVEPWNTEARDQWEGVMGKIMYLYTRVAAGGDVELARQQLKAQLREKIVVDRETIWSKMVAERRSKDSQLQVVTDTSTSRSTTRQPHLFKTPLGTLKIPWWLTPNIVFIAIAVGTLIGIVQGQPFKSREESNCLAMLLFCTILWASEAIPLFVTSFCVPLLTVMLGVIRQEDGKPMPAADSSKYIFSVMFTPTIGLLLGGFTIASALSKTRLDVMTASRVLNAAGSKPSVVLLCLMGISTFASMWISNVAAPTLCYALIKPITDQLSAKSSFSRCLIIAIALAANIGGQASPISSPQNLIGLAAMDPPLSWLQWFAISIPVASFSVLAIWAYLHIGYRWEHDLSIPRMRKNTDPLTWTHWYVIGATALTIALWCMEKSFEKWVGDMGVIAIVPVVAFFGPGILSTQDFHAFQWSIVFIAMSGSALGKAVLSSGLLDSLDSVLSEFVDGMSLFSVLLVFAAMSLVVATFISHTIAAVLLVPVADRIGSNLPEPHPRLLIMACTLICSAGMGLPQSGFPNITAIAQTSKLGQRYIGASDFLKNGIPASVLATIVIVTVGFAISNLLGL